MHKCLLLVDAAQTAGVLPLYPEEWGVDLCAMPGHKALLGAQGTGALYIRPGLDLEPLKAGGTGTSSHLLTQPRERAGALRERHGSTRPASRASARARGSACCTGRRSAGASCC